jgi:2-succinyl-5-enolpyruvyl-6-hydroxy-3-cyclohexene-1-carboxylate synthase
MCSHQVGKSLVRDEVLCFGRQTLAKPVPHTLSTVPPSPSTSVTSGSCWSNIRAENIAHLAGCHAAWRPLRPVV